MMDPFRPLAESRGILHSCLVRQSFLEFDVQLPDLRQWRRDGLQIEVRMIRVDQTKLCHVWPHRLCFSVNGKEVFSVIPAEEGHKRRDLPVEVSSSFAQGANIVNVHMEDDQVKSFAFALVLVVQRDVKDLTKEVKPFRSSKAQAWMQDALAKLQGQGKSTEDDIVCLSTNKLKLICPITMERVVAPVRGENCQHLQCFGLDAYLTSNLKMGAFNNRWMCPVCSLSLRPAQLRLDAYVVSILEGTTEDDEEVTILPDGSWKAAMSTGMPRPHMASSSASCPQEISAVDLGDSDSEDGNVMSLLTQPDPQQPVASSPEMQTTQPVASPARQSGANSNKRRCLGRPFGVAKRPGSNVIEPQAQFSSFPTAAPSAQLIELD
jgi:hypothetical protein